MKPDKIVWIVIWICLIRSTYQFIEPCKWSYHSEAVSTKYCTSISVQNNTTIAVYFLLPQWQHFASMILLYLTKVFLITCPSSFNRSIPLFSTAPSSPPLSFTVRADTSRSLFFSWEPPLPEHQNGIIRHYVITITSIDGSFSVSTPTTATNYTVLAPIRPFITYTCDIAAETVAVGPVSEDISILTPQDGNEHTINSHVTINSHIPINSHITINSHIPINSHITIKSHITINSSIIYIWERAMEEECRVK